MQVLQDFYSQVLKLSDIYPASIEIFKETVYVATNMESINPPEASGVTTQSLNELVNRTISYLVAKSSRSSKKHVLTLGFRKPTGGQGASLIRGMVGVEAYFPNTIVNYLLSKPWESLHSAVGDEAMSFLLLNTSLFMTLENDCLLQVSGNVLHEIERIKMPCFIAFGDRGLEKRKLLYQHPTRSRDGSAIFCKSDFILNNAPLKQIMQDVFPGSFLKVKMPSTLQSRRQKGL